MYQLVLHEEDRPGFATRNRRIYTVGARLFRSASPEN
jgi:hypothetical protein